MGVTMAALEGAPLLGLARAAFAGGVTGVGFTVAAWPLLELNAWSRAVSDFD
jgi:hypothetical protein